MLVSRGKAKKKTRKINHMSIKMKMTMCLAAAVFAVPLVNNATNQGEAAKKMPIPLGFTVVDSAGKTVGPVIGNIGGGAFGSPDSTEFTSVAIGFNGKWLPIQVSRTQLGQPSLDFLDFETPDCSGQPFAPLLGFSPFPETTVAPPGPRYISKVARRRASWLAPR